MVVRHRPARRRRSLSPASTQRSATQAAERADDQVVEEAVERRSEVEKLLALLEGLSDRDREIVALKYGADLSNGEIARMLKLSETNVSTLIYRIVGKLRQEWDSDDQTG